MNNRKVKEILSSAEQNYRDCWNILISLKTGPCESLVEFQPRLSTTLLELTATYREIHQLRQYLIARKARLNKSWFVKRQRVLDDRQQAILRVIAVGRTLGDAFAWFFYQNDPDYLERHRQHPRQEHSPPGIGGFGEHTFIKDFPMINGLMVIYHGITSLLRIGDISLIDLNQLRVVAIGELKTAPVDGKIVINLTAIGNEHAFRSNSFEISNSTQVPRDLLNQKQHQRLKQQLERIRNIINPNNRVNRLSNILEIEENRYVSEFNKFLRRTRVGQFKYQQFGEGLLCAAYRRKKSSLYWTVLGPALRDLDQKLKDLPKITKHLLISSSPHNQLLIGSMLYDTDGKSNLLIGAIPIFWWNLDDELIRKIIFQEIIVQTIYNPAHLLAKLEAADFSISGDGHISNLSIQRRIDHRVYEVGGISYFVELIRESFFVEQQVVKMLIDSVEELAKQDTIQHGHVQLRFLHRLR